MMKFAIAKKPVRLRNETPEEIEMKLIIIHFELAKQREWKDHATLVVDMWVLGIRLFFVPMVLWSWRRNCRRHRRTNRRGGWCVIATLSRLMWRRSSNCSWLLSCLGRTSAERCWLCSCSYPRCHSWLHYRHHQSHRSRRRWLCWRHRQSWYRRPRDHLATKLARTFESRIV